MKKETSKPINNSLILKLVLLGVILGFGALLVFINIYVNRIASMKAELSHNIAPKIVMPEIEVGPVVSKPTTTPTIGMANPASTNCIAKGGNLKIESRPDGGQYGVCYFEDNRQCEEWALFRGDCPVGGLKVTGYITPAATFCAISGGRYAVTKEFPAVTSENEEGTCTFKNGQKCDVWKFYDGSCSSSKAE